jgi:hypothetical protein
LAHAESRTQARNWKTPFRLTSARPVPLPRRRSHSRRRRPVRAPATTAPDLVRRHGIRTSGYMSRNWSSSDGAFRRSHLRRENRTVFQSLDQMWTFPATTLHIQIRCDSPEVTRFKSIVQMLTDPQTALVHSPALLDVPSTSRYPSWTATPGPLLKKDAPSCPVCFALVTPADTFGHIERGALSVSGGSSSTAPATGFPRRSGRARSACR